MNVKLNEDGSNWPFYRRNLQIRLYLQGLARHVRGTAQYESRWYAPWNTKSQKPLSYFQINRFERQLSKYLQKEAQGSKVLAETLPTLIYQRVIRYETLYEKLNALGTMFPLDNPHTLKKVQMRMDKYRYEGGVIQNHVWQMMEFREQLRESGYHMDDLAYIAALIKSFEGFHWFQETIKRASENPGCSEADGQLCLDRIHNVLFERGNGRT